MNHLIEIARHMSVPAQLPKSVSPVVALVSPRGILAGLAKGASQVTFFFPMDRGEAKPSPVSKLVTK